MTALFAESQVAAYDAFSTPIPGGWLNHHWIQLAYHLADSASGLSYSFVMTVCVSIQICDYSVLTFDSDYYLMDHALHPRSSSPRRRTH